MIIAQGLYQEAKMELGRSRGNTGYKKRRPTADEIKKYKKRRHDLEAKRNQTT